ncbi:MAG: aminotransferase class V-fold PLP-dependent enzyme [Verrucomicrobia bacterium]|nr:aminotransferase class V-fold PLP-dependent enzyme [Verrucomicrobiota bacterium]
MRADAQNNFGSVNRREFARLFAWGGSAAVFARTGFTWARPALPGTPAAPDEKFWLQVREQFVMPPDLGVLNAANLCPSPAPVLEAMYGHTRDMDRDPSFQNRVQMSEGKEATRRALAEFLRVTPEEIVITRNTSESNNLVSSGVDLKLGDEVLLCWDNHPSNLAAWQEKSKRWGFTIRLVEQVNPHPGFDYYLDAFSKAMSARTKMLGFTHLTSTVGDLFPAKELCRLARERGILTLVDGAQSLGLLDVDLREMQPDFYTGSAHKWPCGPKEVGVLYINKSAQPKIWASILSAMPGAVGISKTFEAFGQRDEPAIMGFGRALKFQSEIGRGAIEARARQLTQMLLEGLRKIEGVKIWTSLEPARSVAVVSFRPGNLDIGKLSAALYAKHRIGCATRLGSDRPGIRFSPHFYNTTAEIDRALAAIKQHMASGV